MYKVYCLTYNNPVKKNAMIEKLDKLDVPYEIHEWEQPPRDRYPTMTACMYGHLKNIERFLLTSDAEFGIFCEDDIYIHKDFKQLVPYLIEDFKRYNFNILVLGCLLYSGWAYNRFPKIKTTATSVPFNSFAYFNYDLDTWGTQMYMIDRKQAEYIIDKYLNGAHDDTSVYEADWTLTKDPKDGYYQKALIFPLLAVEDGGSTANDNIHVPFHRSCFETNYVPELYV